MDGTTTGNWLRDAPSADVREMKQARRDNAPVEVMDERGLWIATFHYHATVQEHFPSREEAVANASLFAAAPDLYEALNGVEFIFARPGENSVERFERLAEAFYRDTGFLRPGKDAPAAGGQPDREERSEKYDAWIDAKVAAARAALAKVSQQQGTPHAGDRAIIAAIRADLAAYETDGTATATSAEGK